MGFADSFGNWIPSDYDVFENKRAQRRIHGQIQAAENLLDGGEPFDDDGFDLDGFDRDGFDQDGFDQDGFDQDGFSRTGIHSSRYTLDIELERFFDEDGFDPFGFDRDGIPRI